MTGLVARSRTAARVESSGARVHNWDRLRILAAADIVGFHVTGEHGLLGVGLPIFLVLAVALATSKPRARPLGDFARLRSHALLVPWVGWSLAMAGFEVVRAALDGDPMFGWAEPAMLLYGPMSHLWFLPFVAVAAVAAHGVQRLRQDRDDDREPFIAFALGGAALAMYPAADVPAPVSQWLFSIPALCVGYGVGRLMARHRRLGVRRLRMSMGVAIFVVVGGAVCIFDSQAIPYALRYFGGAALIVGGLLLPNPSSRWIRGLAPLMLGVYILHPLVFEFAVARIVHRSTASALVVIATMGVTMGLVHLLRKTALLRFL
jgi:hypothetical protein